MTRNELEMEIQTNLMEHEKNTARSYLNKLTPYDNNELVDDFQQDRLDELANKLFDTSKSGLE